MPNWRNTARRRYIIIPMIRDWMNLFEKEAIEAVPSQTVFGSAEKLYHGTNVDNFWLILKSGKLTPDRFGMAHGGPSGVSLSRSPMVADVRGGMSSSCGTVGCGPCVEYAVLTTKPSGVTAPS